VLHGVSLAHFFFVCIGEPFECLPMIIVDPWCEVVMSMELPLFDIDQLVNLTDHTPISMSSVQSMPKIEETCHWIRQFAVVAFAQSIIGKINHFVVNVIVAEIEQNLEILEWSTRPIKPSSTSKTGQSIPFLSGGHSLDGLNEQVRRHFVSSLYQAEKVCFVEEKISERIHVRLQTKAT